MEHDRLHRSQLAPGAVIDGRYRLLRILGHGGFSEVYEAEQLATGQRVAVKVLALDRFGGRDATPARARLAREMRFIGRLAHPHIVRLLDAGSLEHHQLYVVLEYIEGASLRTVLSEQGTLPLPEVKVLMTQVLEALGAAHDKGVIHRDLKPANIMIATQGGRRYAYVVDFGVAGLMRQAHEEVFETLTSPDEHPGTPAYMAPEQLRDGIMSPASDLYAWGLIVLEALTGRPAVRGQSLPHIIYQQLADEPIPIPTELRHHPIGPILERAVAKPVQARWETAQELLAALQDVPDAPLHISHEAGADAQSVRTSASGTSPRRSGTRTVSTPSSSRRAERREVSLVYASPLFSEATAEDADTLHAHLTEFRERGRDLVESFGGVLVPHPGDGILACFGHPVAHDDDPRRACAAAQALVRNASSVAGADVAASVYSGDAVIDREGQAFHGPAVRWALELQHHAPPGGVAVDPITARRLAEELHFEPAGRLALRGYGETDAFVVQRAAAAGQSEPPPGSGSEALVGRKPELEMLRSRWSEAADGIGQVVLLVGDGGIGKSRLVRAVRERVVGTEVPWHVVRCAALHRSTPLFGIRQLLDSLVSALHGSVLLEHLRASGLESPRVEVLGNLLDDAVEVPAISPVRQRQELFGAVLELVSSSCMQAPRTIVVEDLQWVDPSTEEVLAELASEAEGLPVMLLLTARPEYEGPLASRSGITRWQLPPLRANELRALVHERLDDEADIEHVVARAEGNPLYAEELSNAAAELGGSAEGVPATLRGSLQARLSRLGDAYEMARVASVIGRAFSRAQLAAVEDVEPDHVDLPLRALLDANILRRRAHREGPLYEFRHALLRDVAYETILRSERAEIHARVLRVLEAEGAPADLCAHHAELAGHAEAALNLWSRAGSEALASGALLEAAQRFERGLAALQLLQEGPGRDGKELALRSQLGVPLMLTRGYGHPDVEVVYARARQLAATAGRSPEAWPALWGLWIYYHVRAQYSEAQPLAEQLLELSERVDDSGVELAARQALGATLLLRGELDAARGHLERGCAIYEAERHAPLTMLFGQDGGVFCSSHLCWLYHLRGNAKAAWAQAETTRRMYEGIDQRVSQGFALHFIAVLHCLEGDPKPALDLAERLRELSAEQGMPHWLAFADVDEGYARHILGEHDTAARLINAALGQLIPMGSRVALSLWHTVLIDAELAAGRLPVAERLLEETTEFVEQSGERFVAPLLHAAASRVRASG